jgi:virginiamycin B lyase
VIGMANVRTSLLAAMALLVSPLLVVAGTSPAHAAANVFPVPTSSAGLGRITTAPDGSMWFLMQDANKVGRITTSGQIQEFALPPTDSSVEGPAKGLDVGPDGSVWVTTEHGENLVRMSSAGQVLNNWELPYGSPYGGEVRVGPDGVAWVTMNFDESFIVKVTPTGQLIDPANSPECDDVLGEAADGTMWCQNGNASAQDVITRVNADAAGGVSYPLPSDASYPNGLAAGPVGSIWFTRSWSGTFATSPSQGSIGYLDAASGATTIWSTGSRSAPSDLLMGPDRQMWFTNVGAVPGIGHISANGVGAISSVGNYEPTSLTFGPDGAIWFTDEKNNSIVRVTTDQLGTTNVDLGDGVTMIAPTTPTPTPTGGTAAGAVAKVKGVRPVKRGKVKVPLSCPAAAAAGCAGTLRLELAKGGKALAKSKRYQVAAGKKATVTVKLSKKGLAKLRRGKVVKVRVELSVPGSKKVAAKRTIKVRRA